MFSTMAAMGHHTIGISLVSATKSAVSCVEILNGKHLLCSAFLISLEIEQFGLFKLIPREG